ncbi:MAG: CapA family protein [Bryobacteraceae bacterium]|nr:CapA family protein [Bryobacteraceae bacterium]
MISRRSFLAGSAFVQAPLTRVVCGGDVMLTRWVGRKAAEEKDWLRPLRGVAPAFLSADIGLVNLESPFSETGPYDRTDMVFRARPEMVEALTGAGINAVSLANNHVRDAGAEGLEYTIKLLERNGIVVAGVGREAVIERQGVKFRILAYTYDQRNGNWESDDPRVAGLDAVKAAADVAAARALGETVIVAMHAGREYHKKANVYQRAFAAAVVKAGAACVAGHHPHVVQESEEIGGVPVFYSLGNLVFDQKDPGTGEGLLAEMIFEGGRVGRWRTLETRITNGAAKLLHKYEEFR